MLPEKLPTILVVDDDDSARGLVCHYLESSGFKFYSALSGSEAIKVVSAPDLIVDILLTDIIMPYMNGRVLANRICSIKPQIKVVFMSAYSGDFLSGHQLSPEGSDYIRKPFNQEALLSRLIKTWHAGPKWKDLVSRKA